MHPIHLVTSGLDAELQALLDLHAAQTIRDFWQSARRVLHSALPVAAIWFAPSPDWLLQCAYFRAETAFKSSAEFHRFQERHPLIAFLRANPHTPLATFGDALTEARLLKSRFYREFMAPQHERFSVVLAFWRRTSLRGVIGLSRLKNEPGFSRAELRMLRELHHHLGAALQRVGELQRERSGHGALELLLTTLPLPIALLDWELDVLYCNGAAKQSAALWDAHWNGRFLKGASRFEIPCKVRELCGNLKTTWNPPDVRRRHSSGSSGVTVAHPSLPGLQVSIRLVHHDPPGLGMPLFMVLFEDLREMANHCLPEGGKLCQFARLSLREREVASLVCEGESNKEVAAKLGKSVLTVKAQLQSIYGKLGMPGRSRLISLMRER